MYRREGSTTPQLGTTNQVELVGVRQMFTSQNEVACVTTGQLGYIACSRVLFDWIFSPGTLELLMDAPLRPVSQLSYVEKEIQAATEP